MHACRPLGPLLTVLSPDIDINMGRRVKPSRSLSMLIRRVASFRKPDILDKENCSPEPRPLPSPRALPATTNLLQPQQQASIPMAEEEDFSSIPLQDRFVHKV